MLLVIVCVHRSVACRLEDVVEKLAASLAVLHRVVALHCHQEGNQVGNSYWALDDRVYTENGYLVPKSQERVVKIKLKYLKCSAHRLLHSAGS